MLYTPLPVARFFRPNHSPRTLDVRARLVSCSPAYPVYIYAPTHKYTPTHTYLCTYISTHSLCMLSTPMAFPVLYP